MLAQEPVAKRDGYRSTEGHEKTVPCPMCPSVPMFFCVFVQREEQVLKVLRSDKSPGCEFCGSGARKGDLLEIEYTARLEDGKVFDGSSIKVGQDEPGVVGAWYSTERNRTCPYSGE